MTDQNSTGSFLQSPSPVDDLARSFDAVGALVARVRPDQWSAPTPCSDWSVRALVDHLIGMNRVFSALLAGQPPPRPTADHVEHDPVGAYRDTAAALLSAFSAPDILDREYRGPLGVATGADRLQIRLYDLLAHGWDLARATGQPVLLPDDVAERSLAFARTQLGAEARPGRFGPARDIGVRAPAIERLVAFLGRSLESVPAAPSSMAGIGPARLRRGIVRRVREDVCEIRTEDGPRVVRYAPQFPSPRIERVFPGHLVAIATAPDGTDVIVWRWYDAVVVEELGTLVRLWEPAHGEVLAQPRPSYAWSLPGTRAYLSAGLPGAEWWVAGPAADSPDDADVELDEVERVYTEHNLWDDLS
ncbi:MAG TPA: TIGR03086 family metal-binding protein [Jatrophihabitantaceae bacterium]